MHWIDPHYLPRINGVVDRFLINGHGEVDGLLLADGTEVHVPPHLDAELRAAAQPGAAIGVFGVRPQGVEMISAVAIEAGPGRLIADNGPPKRKHAGKGHANDDEGGHAPHAKPHRPQMEAEGTLQRVLYGPKGEARGALLQPGATLAARGPGVTVDGLQVVDAKEVGATLASLQPVRPKPPKDGSKPKGGKHLGGKQRHGEDHKAPKHA